MAINEIWDSLIVLSYSLYGIDFYPCNYNTKNEHNQYIISCNRKIAVQNDLWKFCYKIYENSCKHKNLSILSVFRGNRCRKNCSRIASQVVNFMTVLTANLERCRLTRKHVTRMKHRERERERERERNVSEDDEMWEVFSICRDWYYLVKLKHAN